VKEAMRDGLSREARILHALAECAFVVE